MAWTLERVGLTGGLYRGLLRGAGDLPPLRAVLDGADVDGLEIVAIAGEAALWEVSCPVPAEMIADDLRVLTFQSGDDVLDRLAVAAGSMVEDDVRTEIATLRAEVDLVKKALRRISNP